MTMNRRFLSGSILALLILLAFAACKTKQVISDPVRNEPDFIELPQRQDLRSLTVPILEQIIKESNGNTEAALSKMQLYLSEGITLERRNSQLSLNLDKDGGVNFLTVSTPETINLNSALMGVGRSINPSGAKITLHVLFQKDDENKLLSFSNIGDHRDQFFYLDYSLVSSGFGSQKGEIPYGSGDPFSLSFNGDRTPHLLISVSEEFVPSPTVRNETGLSVQEYQNMRNPIR